MPRSANSSSQPVHKIRHGVISASIWRKDTGKGSMFNVSFQRGYREGETWKNTGTFGQRDLLVVGFIAARAFEWIAGQQVKAKSATPAKPSDDDGPY